MQNVAGGNKQNVRQLLTILLIGIVSQGYCGATDPDTIDHWQVYNGAELIFGGHDLSPGSQFHGTIKTADFKKLVVQYNHCVRFPADFEVTLEIRDEKGKHILAKKFKGNSGLSMTIEKEELGQLATKVITIRYREKRENGTDRILGRITFV